ncbi:MAG TPA: hypothetical protein DEP85_02885 [Holosporales bacterium]|nr:MAG: hypothetical protein A2Z91_02845 [Deltaproteobacteria bacterium GWA2_38_16]OGQ02825.1 MAG: hypothetical protein A3D19_06270 [Deltaproteobacteria bacterium RIFCSPHIGHO2_02_FULL_38_15]OGQ34914.1 MAG: hypothetical protein A3A72_00500 [Deltaproteobacteria bacterium RIFCSPLOWO2_01_FULL_38_9]HBQ21668.1 hypothetical protein [Deltaproteobacteria bacterium]HCC24444.1 hypothetical protein [Holosporales bacterium]
MRTDNLRAMLAGLILLLTVISMVKLGTHNSFLLAQEDEFNTNISAYLDQTRSGSARLDTLDKILEGLSKDVNKWLLLRPAMVTILNNKDDDLYVQYQGLLKLQKLPTVGPSLIINLLYDNTDAFTASIDRLNVIIEALANSQEKTALPDMYKLVDDINTKTQNIDNGNVIYSWNTVLDKIGRYLGSINDLSTIQELLKRYNDLPRHQTNIRIVMATFLDYQLRNIEGRKDFTLSPEDITLITSMIGSETFLDKTQDKFFVLGTLFMALNGDPKLFVFIINYLSSYREQISPKRQAFLTQILEKAEEVKSLYEAIRIKQSSDDEGNGTRLLLFFLSMGVSEFTEHPEESKKEPSPERLLYNWFREWLFFTKNS